MFHIFFFWFLIINLFYFVNVVPFCDEYFASGRKIVSGPVYDCEQNIIYNILECNASVNIAFIAFGSNRVKCILFLMQLSF